MVGALIHNLYPYQLPGFVVRSLLSIQVNKAKLGQIIYKYAQKIVYWRDISHPIIRFSGYILYQDGLCSLKIYKTKISIFVLEKRQQQKTRVRNREEAFKSHVSSSNWRKSNALKFASEVWKFTTTHTISNSQGGRPIWKLYMSRLDGPSVMTQLKSLQKGRF